MLIEVLEVHSDLTLVSAGENVGRSHLRTSQPEVFHPAESKPLHNTINADAAVTVAVSSGGGPLLGRGPRGVGQPRAAAPPNEAPGGMPEDLSRAMFCGKCLPPRRN